MYRTSILVHSTTLITMSLESINVTIHRLHESHQESRLETVLESSKLEAKTDDLTKEIDQLTLEGRNNRLSQKLPH